MDRTQKDDDDDEEEFFDCTDHNIDAKILSENMASRGKDLSHETAPTDTDTTSHEEVNAVPTDCQTSESDLDDGGNDPCKESFNTPNENDDGEMPLKEALEKTTLDENEDLEKFLSEDEKMVIFTLFAL